MAQETLDLMRLHGVPPTSANYEVWLSYRLGRNQRAARGDRSTRIAAGEGFTPEYQRRDLRALLHRRSAPPAQIVLAGERIAHDLGQVLAFLKSAEEKSGDYGRTLESAATDLNRGLSAEQIRQVVSSLAAATLDMANHNQHLTEQLQKSTREIETLRSSLESVRVESRSPTASPASPTGACSTKRCACASTRRARSARELCLLLCDIDHFKRFNDTWGHHTGDQILRFLASALQAHARPDHLVARYGGEEFAMIMPRVSAARRGANSPKRCAPRSRPSACAGARPTKIWARSPSRSASRGCSRATRCKA